GEHRLPQRAGAAAADAVADRRHRARVPRLAGRRAAPAEGLSMAERKAYARLALLSRLGAAIGGAYLAANLLSIVIAQLLPGPRANSALAGMTMSFGIYALLVMWAIAARSAARAWLNLLGLSAG